MTEQAPAEPSAVDRLDLEPSGERAAGVTIEWTHWYHSFLPQKLLQTTEAQNCQPSLE